MNHDLNALLQEALMCSVFICPNEPGLTAEEILEVGRRAGFRDGEIWDTFANVSKQEFGRDRFVPTDNDLLFGEVLDQQSQPLLDADAADFVSNALNERIRADGQRAASLDRRVVVERAMSQGLDGTAVEAAITCFVLVRRLSEREGRISSNLAHELLPIFAEKRRRPASWPRAMRPRALAIARDVISRRTDGRARQADPLDAFPDALEGLGFRHLRMWWMQTVQELRCSDPALAPVSTLVLSAALVEGALTFVVKHARDRDLGPFRSRDFEREPRTWKIDDLIASAATGGDAAILSLQVRARAEILNRARQRIHAGRMIAEHPAGLPDLRPEEAREAKGVAEQVARAVLDWLERYPPA